MTHFLLTDLVNNLPAAQPFVGPETMERAQGFRFRARLGANESAFGPSGKVIAAMRDACDLHWMYSDPESYDLRGVIANHHGVEPANVVVGEGIDGLLGLTVRAVIDRGDAVVTSDGAYPTFNYHVAGAAGRLIKVAYHDDREDLDALLDTAKRETAKMVYISNPDNPMGSWWGGGELDAAIARLPGGTLLCLDEAYCDTAPGDAVPPLDVANPQVLRFRTFSKAYGLAGARIGYVMGHEDLISAFEKIRNHYGINRVGQIGASEALKDQGYLRAVTARIARSRDLIGKIARSNGLAPLPSATNFVTIDCGADGVFAGRVLQACLQRGVFIRMPGVEPLNRCIRVTTAPDDVLDIFANVLPDALKAARG